ncbi:transcriptional regulator [Embleya hyalina]|uniref:Transcriptional regulator n=1 Tax=Embleya hyalina TaxID=516124 RepID=A0A401Z4P5_9ACTN|nr:transcriptional regulator [Embleya hyalina]
MVVNVLQEIVDRLSESLRRAVAVDDPDLRLMVCSSHFDDADDARLNALLTREATAGQKAHVAACGVHKWRGAAVIPADPAVGLAYDRWCVPLRSRFETLGYLWITLPDGEPPTAQAQELVVEFCETLEHILFRHVHDVKAIDEEIESALLGLLDPVPAGRESAARELHDLGMFNRVRAFVAFAVAVPEDWAPWGGTSPQDILAFALWRALPTLMTDAYSFAPTVPESFALIGYRNTPPRDELQAIAAGVARELHAYDARFAEHSFVGVGAPVDALQDSVHSYEQALVAIGIGRAEQSRVTVWQDHPVAAALATYLAPRPEPHLVPTQFARLSGMGADTLAFLRAHLAHAGNATDTAAALGVHRATIYARVRKLQEVTGLDLDDGRTRLAVHAWLTVSHP